MQGNTVVTEEEDKGEERDKIMAALINLWLLQMDNEEGQRIKVKEQKETSRRKKHRIKG